MEWRKILQTFVSSLIVGVIGWFGAPYVKSKMEGTPLNGVSGILSFWKRVFNHPIPMWSVLGAIVVLATTVILVTRLRKGRSKKADLKIVVLPTPEPRWSIGAFGTVPYMSLSFHARLAHREDYSLEIVKGYLEGTTCSAPFMPFIVAGPYDNSTTVHLGVRPIMVKDGESITGRIILVDQFGNGHRTEKITFRASSQPAGRFGATPITCFFCRGVIAMEDLHEAASIPAHKGCVK
jgi:hypothetical protein